MQRARRVVVVSALGYFVDILDLFLFNVVRQPSLRDLGVPVADSRIMLVRRTPIACVATDCAPVMPSISGSITTAYLACAGMPSAGLHRQQIMA